MQETACNPGDLHLIPGSGRFSGEGNGNSLQYSCQGNPMDRGAWWATAHGVTRVRHDLGTKPPLHFNRLVFQDISLGMKVYALKERMNGNSYVPLSCLISMLQFTKHVHSHHLILVYQARAHAQSLSPFGFLMTPWTVACQAPQSMGLFRQEYRSRLPFPSPENLPDPGVEPTSPVFLLSRQIFYTKYSVVCDGTSPTRR